MSLSSRCCLSHTACCLLLSLLLISQIALRICPFDLRIRPSITLPISLLSSLFSLLSLLSSLFTRCCCCWLQDAVAVAELFAARSILSIICALPSSVLGADPFLYHPALLEPHRCLLRPRGRVSSHFALVPSNFASGHPFRFQSTLPCASPSLARRNARSD